MTDMSAPSMRMPPRGYLAVIRTIDKFTTLAGCIFVLAIIPLIFANVVEVFAATCCGRRRSGLST